MMLTFYPIRIPNKVRELSKSKLDPVFTALVKLWNGNKIVTDQLFVYIAPAKRQRFALSMLCWSSVNA